MMQLQYTRITQQAKGSALQTIHEGDRHGVGACALTL